MGTEARTAELSRETRETKIRVRLSLDGTGQSRIKTGLGMLDHMLEQLARHGRFDIEIEAQGDLEVDEHHTVEDVALVLGRCLAEALGERRGIVRMGHAVVPMDEALALAAVDLSGRGHASVQVSFDRDYINDFPTDLAKHFLETLASEGRFNLHVRLLAGENDHHRLEAVFKALARALDQATAPDERLGGQVPSTKGTVT